MTTYHTSNSNKFTLYGRQDERSTLSPNNHNNHPKKRAPVWKIMKSDVNPNSKHLYALSGVVIHRGTPFAGHYFAYLKDFLKEGRFQPSDYDNQNNSTNDSKDSKDDETKNQTGNNVNESDERLAKIINKIENGSYWYDFNDSSVNKIRTEKIAKQYGGEFECAYMLIYRKINGETLEETMKKQKLSLPPDLQEFLNKENERILEERRKREALNNQITIRILHPKCFIVEDGKLFMKPFVESLLKKFIAISRQKAKLNKIISNASTSETAPKSNVNPNETKEEKEEREKLEKEEEEKEIERLYQAKRWPGDLSREITEIVAGHYKEHSIFIKCDGKQSVDKLMPLIMEKLKEEKTDIDEEQFRLHFISIPNAKFQTVRTIASLMDSNIASNIEDKILPVNVDRLMKMFKARNERQRKQFGDENKEEKDSKEEDNDKENKDDSKDDDDDTRDEYPYERIPKLIRDLPFSRGRDFILDNQLCFVWDGKCINGKELNLKVARTVEINVRVFKESKAIDYKEERITVPIGASLNEIWEVIKEKFEESAPIKKPVFTVLSQSSYDEPEIVYLTNDNETRTRRDFAKLLHYKFNPIMRWRREKFNGTANQPRVNARDRNNFVERPMGPMTREEAQTRPRSNSAEMNMGYNGLNRQNGSIYHDDLHRANYSTHNQYSKLRGEAIICVEDALLLPEPNKDTKAAQSWTEKTKFSTITVEDHTQVVNEEEGKDDEKDDAKDKEKEGANDEKKIKHRTIEMRLPKGTSLQDFFVAVRKQCNVPDDVDLRVFQVTVSNRYLISFPHKFQLPKHHVLVERGRYPKVDEVFLMVAMLHNGEPSQYMAVILERKKSVKYLKQQIMKLFHLNPNEYKKYTCWELAGDKKIKCWGDSLTMNSNATNPRQGTRVGIEMGTASFTKQIMIIRDMRMLDKPWDFSHAHTDPSVLALGNGLNPYASQELAKLNLDSEITFDQLRQQIHSIESIKNDVKSFKHLRVSWFDHIYKKPLSFPLIVNKKLSGQKNWDSQKSILCVECMNEPLETVSQHARFLHVYLARIDINEDVQVEMTNLGADASDKNDDGKNDTNDTNDKENKDGKDDKNDKNDEDGKDDKDGDDAKEEKEEKVNVWKSDNQKLVFWPPDNHVRILYDEGESAVTYSKVCIELGKRYDIKVEDMIIALFKLNKNEWILLDNSCDESEHGMAGPPFNIRKTSRDNDIFAVFDINHFNVKSIEMDDKDRNTKIRKFIEETLEHWPRPPLHGKAKFLHGHFQSSNVGGYSSSYVPPKKSSYERGIQILTE